MQETMWDRFITWLMKEKANFSTCKVPAIKEIFLIPNGKEKEFSIGQMGILFQAIGKQMQC